jgi:hypothetical protein
MSEQLEVSFKKSLTSKKRLAEVLASSNNPRRVPSSVKAPIKIHLKSSLNHTAETPEAKHAPVKVGLKKSSRQNSLGTISLSNIAKARDKMGNFIVRIDQYKNRLQKEREQMKGVVHSRREFQNSSFEKYLAVKAKPLDRATKKYKVQLTTNYCSLNEPKVYLELLSSPQTKIVRSTSNFVRDLNLNLNSPAMLRNSGKENHRSVNEIPLPQPKKSFGLESTVKNILSSIKLKTNLQNSAIKRQTEIVGLREKITNLGVGFKHKLNQKLMLNLFNYQLKLNSKTNVIRILSIYPNFVNIKDRFQRYPVHYSASRSMGKMTKILISFDSPLDFPDHQGKRPLDYAYANANLKIIRVG